MTFSIVGRSPDGLSLGVAVASKFLSVGAAVPAVEVEVGALATQSFANLAYRVQGLAMLRTGTTAADTIAGLTAADPGRATRQLGVVGRQGPGATFTGDECFPWAGGVAGDGYAIQGNILTGADVVLEMEAAWLAEPGAPLARRLHAALAAGDRAGGDSRGRQSAALIVVRRGAGYGGLSDVEVDLRVDDDPDPVTRLGGLLDLWDLYFRRPDPATLLPLTGALADEVAGRLRSLGFADLAGWAGVENLEERLVEDAIDPLVLAHLRAATPDGAQG
ncbi:DUF1028 domain-containing protein [Dactylosporangium aurantiacum]|uniref:DUF1028 domain-containing protein n=1 Tax=Dactylosporangium aurantiacum TaxID=35754 RepID=A0A9Q9INI8_9ACTN|nr:DUF1028 domain-containing protein [Dactylosporangium aurantiacum]MDG6109738.1 DUF1028 domain-containing protein [Dactylosporangium aurantiacum]UWZ56325.1 DUF1028 domain-containing protein [Dactylosporangium aurantiacum]